MAQAAQELRSEPISASVKGRPIIIATDFTVVGDVTTLHAMTDALVSDIVWIKVTNNSSAAELLSLILNPIDDTVLANVNDATIKISIPAQRTVFLLQGERFRQVAGNSYTIAAYAPNTTGNMRATGWFNRLSQGAITP